MYIRIIRGQNQIGGNIIEIRSQNTKIILDTGKELEEEIIEVPLVKGLFKDKADYDAVLITHYHEDHIGLINNILHFLYKSIEDFKNYNIFNNY